MSTMTHPLVSGVTFGGRVNIDEAQLADQIRASIRRGATQVRPDGLKHDSVAIVGGGPSLTHTIEELRDLVFEGVKVVALNGAAEWLVSHNIRPSAVVVLDARASNARFVQRAIPGCKYFLASQCHGDTWDAVEGRPDVFIFHALMPDAEHAPILNEYYGEHRWCPVNGGVTVGTRAIWLFRILGYLRFHLFGLDSCWLGGEHHAYEQPENSADLNRLVRIKAHGLPEREFACAPWHLKQLDDFLQLIHVLGDKFQLQVHGPGLLAAALSDAAEIRIAPEGGE